jgi:flagellar motor protein MotB
MQNFIWFSEPDNTEEDDDASTYLSIGDLMSGLLMFFVLLFITALAQIDEPKRVVIGNVIGEMKNNNINVKVNPETGDISIQESILFAQGSTELKPEGKDFLRRFIPVYSRVIFSKPEIENEISRVMIEGHTSSEGDDKTNMELSVLRFGFRYLKILLKI